MKNTNPTVSIIVPTYNRARFISRAIDSILAQTYTDYEIIIVDDGSTDNTKEVLKKYQNKIKCIYQENAGVSAARNAGIKSSKAEWIAFLDSDDEWLPKKLEVQMSALMANEELVAHTVNAKFIPQGSRKSTTFENCGFPIKQKSGILKRPLTWQLKYAILAMAQTVVCKRSASLETGLFDESLRIYHMDDDFLNRLALEGAWGFSSKELVIIHREAEIEDSMFSGLNFDSKKAFESFRSGKIIYEKLLNSPKINYKERKEVKTFLSRASHGEGMWRLRRGQIHEARKLFLNSLKNHFSVKPCLGALITLFPYRIAKNIANAWLHVRQSY